jgi:hypothetical protein
MKKRVLLALVVALIVFGAVYASAAALNVSGGFIQAGGDADLTCDEGAYVSAWGLEVDDGKVYFVRIDGVDGTCAGARFFAKVSLEDGSNVQVNTVLSGASEYVLHFADPIPAENIVGIDLFIEGAGG